MEKISKYPTSSMNKKGQITLPSKIRKSEGFCDGQQFAFLKTEEGILLIPLLSISELQDDLIQFKDLAKNFDSEHEIELELEK